MSRARRGKLMVGAVLLASLSGTAGGLGASDAVSMKKITVRGVCVDQRSTPLYEVRVRIFRYASSIDAPELIAELTTDFEGKFVAENIETASDRTPLGGMGDLCVAATADRRASAIQRIDNDADDAEVSLMLPDDAGTLSGVVTDAAGKPVRGATVFLPFGFQQPLPDVRSAVTDEAGRYAIPDLKRWKSGEPNGQNRVVTSYNLLVQHPDYPQTMAPNTAVPQTLNITLQPAAVAEGKVTDAVTHQPAANVIVSAQGVAWSGWFQTRTDQDGRYRLMMTKDHYNIWAEAEDRIAIAVKALGVEPGKTVIDADIKLVRGGFVSGRVIDAANNKPISPPADRPQRVAHYGPARPRTGAAVTSTKINPDGTYRLRVAPGANYIYSMTGGGRDSQIVAIKDGEELTVDLVVGQRIVPPRAPDPANDFAADLRLAAKLRQQAQQEDARRGNVGVVQNLRPAKPPSRKRGDTPAGRLLDKLEAQNSGDDLFKDEWCRTLQEIVELGPAAVPELIEELDATQNDRMLRCLGFMLRAIGDKRAVPGLIRAIPRTLLPPGSDMGLRSDDPDITRFMQRHDLNPQDRENHFGFGRPVREIGGALQTLTGRKEDEEQLYHIFLGGMANQQRMKRELFQRTAEKWAAWWKEAWIEQLDDKAYARVNLPERVAVEAGHPPQPGAHFRIMSGSSGWILQPALAPEAKHVFYDLDTGRAAALPEKWRQAENREAQLEAIIAWAAREGYDLMGVEHTSPGDGQRVFALRSIGMRTWELGMNRWKMESDDITIEALEAEGAPAGDLLLHYDQEKEQFDPKATASFFYLTREGTPGLLFVGIEVRDTQVKLGVPVQGDNELNPVGFYPGRRFGFKQFAD